MRFLSQRSNRFLFSFLFFFFFWAGAKAAKELLGDTSASRYSPFLPGILASKCGCFQASLQLTSEEVRGRAKQKSVCKGLAV